jgi:hypothetical protein
MRCRIPLSSATDEMVPKQNTDPGQRAILHWKVIAIELAWINDTPPTWRASCRCLEPDYALRVTPRGAFGRTVLLNVTQWFVQDARETVDRFLQVRASLRCVTPYFLVWIFMWWVTREFSSMEKANELSRRLMNDLEMMGDPLCLIYSTVGHYMHV